MTWAEDMCLNDWATQAPWSPGFRISSSNKNSHKLRKARKVKVIFLKLSLLANKKDQGGLPLHSVDRWWPQELDAASQCPASWVTRQLCRWPVLRQAGQCYLPNCIFLVPRWLPGQCVPRIISYSVAFWSSSLETQACPLKWLCEYLILCIKSLST